MRDETRQRLERALFMRRLKFAAGIAAVALAIGAAFWLEALDAGSRRQPVAGIVEHVGPIPGKTSIATAASTVAVDVKLPDGRVAHVATPKAEEPHVGDQVTIVELIHGTGRHSFSWR